MQKSSKPFVLPERTLLLLLQKAWLDLAHQVALPLQRQDCDWPFLGRPGQQQLHTLGWQEPRI